jgi:S1-C subfamily serine protease
MRRMVSLAVVSCLCGCASSAPPAASASRTPPPLAQSASSRPPPAPPGAHTLARSVVRGVVAQGLGAFLQRLEVDEHPVLLGGKFRGFRIMVLRGTDFWTGVDLMPGDVVTGVNGFPIERPEQAQTAFDSLVVASQLRVAYDRGGQERELVYSIVDDR